MIKSKEGGREVIRERQAAATMAPKGKDKTASGAGAGKGKGKGKDASKADDDKGGAKVKGAQQINVRHILCEKHARKEEVVAKLRDGAKFDEVAREMSEDKARAGVYFFPLSFFSPLFLWIPAFFVSWHVQKCTCYAVQMSGDNIGRDVTPAEASWTVDSTYTNTPRRRTRLETTRRPRPHL